MTQEQEPYRKEFRVMARSENTNSFGLYQMYVISRDGDVFKTHASQYHVRDRGETVIQTIFMGLKIFQNHELTEELPEKAPKELIEQFW